MKRIVVERASIMLEKMGLSGNYRKFFLEHIVYSENRLLHSAIGCSRYRKLTIDKSALEHNRVFGCVVFVFNKYTKSKFDAIGQPGILLEFGDNGIYTVELLRNNNVVSSVHIKLYETGVLRLDSADSSLSGGERT